MRNGWTKISSGERTGLWAVVLLGAVLGLQYLGGWYAVELARISEESELEAHLADLGQLAPPTLADPVLGLSDLALDATLATAVKTGNDKSTTPDPEIYRQGLDKDLTGPLARFAADARLAKLIVISDQGRILYDTAVPGRLLVPYDFWEIDRPQIEQALKGQAAASPAYSTPKDSYKRFYVPIRDAGLLKKGEAPRPAHAIVCLVAGRTYLAGISRLAQGLTRLNLVLTLLMAGLGLLIHHLIRRQRRIERQAAESDRLAGLGTLAAGFAHELRNPLEIIRAFTEDLERTLRSGAPPAEAVEACQDIVEEVDRMNRLVGQFLSYSRGPNKSLASGKGADAQPTPLLATAGSVLAMLRPSAEKHALSLELEHPGAPAEQAWRWTVRLEAGSLKQILINLTLNAIQASPERGRVILAISVAGRQAELRVRDQGPGIPEKECSRIFEPFYSTRQAGSGLGLAVSRRLAVEAGGTLKLEGPPPGRGACFILTLPRAEDAGALVPAEPPAPDEQGVR